MTVFRMRAFTMIRLTGLNEDDIKEISWQIADAFYDYQYSSEDIGLQFK